MRFKSQAIWLWMVGAAFGVLAGGCSSVPEHYRPQTLGLAAEGYADAGLSISIEPDRDTVHLGESIQFKVTYRNIGERVFLFPRNPEALFVWIYPDGTRDNFIMKSPGPIHYTPGDVLKLAPGTEVTRHFPLETYYFDHRGITEFRAVFRAGRNTNPDLDNVWAGKAYSNAYGVMVAGRNRLAMLHDDAAAVTRR